MPKRHQRSRGLKRRVKRLPGGRNVTHYKPGRARRARCSICSAELHGYSSRPFGGNVCHRCLERGLRAAVRGPA